MKKGILLFLVLMAGLSARVPGFRESWAVQESLSRIHPRFRASWLKEHGIDDPYYSSFQKSESNGLRCIGRWPWGPSRELCGRDSLLFLGSGSGVRILSITDSVYPKMLGQINARGLVSQLVVKDTLLFVACGNWGAQIYNISNPANPKELSSMDVVIYDLAVVDTFCYTVGSKYAPNDSLRIYKVADPIHPVQVSAVRDSGNVLAVTNGYAFVAGNVTSMNVYDIQNPSSPQWVNSRSGWYLTLFPRRKLLFCSGVQPDYFSILDISDPLSIKEIGRVNGYGGRALDVDDYFAYLSCSYEHQGLYIMDIADPTHPQMRGNLNPEGDNEWDSYIPQPLSYGYLAADYGGLVTIDMHNVNSPVEAFSGYKAHQAVDVHIDNSRCYVAEQCAGLRIIDVSDPTKPQDVGEYDTTGVLDVRSATARDSFAFITYWGNGRRFLRVLDVTDPSQPVFAAEESCFNPPNDIVVRDSFVYLAEANRFEVVNVARPRQPVLVGSCTGDGVAIVVQDTFALTAAGAIQIINIARPESPFVVSTIVGHNACGLAVRDTFLYFPYVYDTLFVYSIANPAQPRMLSATPTSVWPWDVVLGEHAAFVGTTYGIDLYDLSNPAQPRRIGGVSVPYGVRRLHYSGGLLYAVLWEAGVAIHETTAIGIAESPRPDSRYGLIVLPNPTRSTVTLTGVDPGANCVRVYDVTGRCVITAHLLGRRDSAKLLLDVRDLVAGVYFLEIKAGGFRKGTVRFVKQ